MGSACPLLFNSPVRFPRMNLLFAFGLISVTVIVHGLGTLEAFAHLYRVGQRRKRNQGLLTPETQIVRVGSVLVLLHLVEQESGRGSFESRACCPISRLPSTSRLPATPRSATVMFLCLHYGDSLG